MDSLQKQSDALLYQIKNNRPEIEALQKVFVAFEEDYVYRFYHQSFKVFGAVDQVAEAKELFQKLAPEGVVLNKWFLEISDEAIAKSFNGRETNPRWLEETRPILEAFWHSKYFLEQMLRFGAELEESPMLLPSGWAAVLYLYNLR